MKMYINNKEINEETNDRADSKILKALKLYFNFIKEDTIAERFVRDGIMVGRSFHDYISYCEDIVVFSLDELTAKNILSVILMSHDGFNNPLMVYRKYGFRLLQNLNRVSSVETYLIKILNNYTEQKKAENEKDRLSKTST